MATLIYRTGQFRTWLQVFLSKLEAELRLFLFKGHDQNKVLELKDECFYDHLRHTFNPLVMQMRALPKPISASTNGPAAGATLGVALACDLRIASDEAQFMVGFIGVGLILEAGVLFFLPRLIGLGRAVEYAFTNQPITAGQALEWGLVNRLAPADQIRQQVGEWTREIAHVPVGAMGLANLPGKASHGVLLTNLRTTIEQGL
jgi:enoyl-CoA hydratase/carnithine racemase